MPLITSNSPAATSLTSELASPVRGPRTRYELPPQGISLLGYVVRRMHKTALLLPTVELLRQGHTGQALAQIGLYSAVASASYGPAYYQPQMTMSGERLTEVDPQTGIAVSAVLEATRPHYRISYVVDLGGGVVLTGEEEITGTTVGWRGLGMPAPAHFYFATPNGYRAQMVGTVTSELALGFPRWQIRAYGEIALKDSAGNAGVVKISRDRRVVLRIDNGGASELTYGWTAPA